MLMVQIIKMGHQTIISGYIELPLDSKKKVDDYIKYYEYNSIYPFTNTFSVAVEGYTASLVSFATSLKMNQDEWTEWEKEYEKFLEGLDIISSVVIYEAEETGSYKRIEYVFNDKKIEKIE